MPNEISEDVDDSMRSGGILDYLAYAVMQLYALKRAAAPADNVNCRGCDA
jgi:hypothetical protein